MSSGGKDAKPLSKSSSNSESKLNVISVKPLESGSSKYVRPVRLIFNLDGVKNRIWDCMKIHDSVAAVLYNKSRDKLIFVKQFRPAVYLAAKVDDPVEGKIEAAVGESKSPPGYTYELCAGIMDKAKSTEATMKEEILEEVGYDVPLDSIRLISSFRSGVGVTGSLQHLYFCEVNDSQKVASGGGVDEERIEVIELSPEEAKKMMYCKDEEAPASRPPSMLFGLSWFLYEYLPKSQSKRKECDNNLDSPVQKAIKK